MKTIMMTTTMVIRMEGTMEGISVGVGLEGGNGDILTQEWVMEGIGESLSSICIQQNYRSQFKMNFNY